MAKRIVAFSSLYPSDGAPNAGVFIKERLVHLAKRISVSVVAPVPWSPLDWIVRLGRPNFRLAGAKYEVRDGVEVFRPRFLSFPGLFKGLDGWLMSRFAFGDVARATQAGTSTILDAHFAYPDGLAASLIAKRLSLPLVVTLRGSKDRLLMGTDREPQVKQALDAASAIVSVSQALIDEVALKLGQSPSKISLVGNGVDLTKFAPVNRDLARQHLGIDPQTKLLVAVGNLIPLKGFHRIIQALPKIQSLVPQVKLLIIGATPPQGNNAAQLHDLIARLGLQSTVTFCGLVPQAKLSSYYSAADLLVSATQYEGWANVLLESMACGLPVVTTKVGGNPEVVISADYGSLVDFWSEEDFVETVVKSLSKIWNRQKLMEYAASCEWDRRVEQLVKIYGTLK